MRIFTKSSYWLISSFKSEIFVKNISQLLNNKSAELAIKNFSTKPNLERALYGLGLILSGCFITPLSMATDLTWSHSGDVEMIDSTNFQLSTDGLVDDDADLGAPHGEFNFSGNPANLVGFGGLEDFLGIDTSQLDLDGIAYEGSAIKTSLNLTTRTKVSFDWEFFTNETEDTLAPLSPTDYGFFFIGQTVNKLADGNNTNQTTCNFSFDTCTGVQTTTYILDPGQYTLGFGVIDIDDFLLTSVLTISNFTLTTISQQPATLPEPNLIVGIFAITGLVRIFRHKPKF
jgi:hypothetical protein